MIEVCRLLERTPSRLVSFVIVDIPIPLVDPWIIMSDHLQVALEQVMVRDIESRNRRIQPDICFGEVLAKQE